MRYIKILFCSFVLFIIYGLFFLTINNDNRFSYLERRSLETFPKFSINNIFDKNYYDNLTTAFSDQLEFRNYLVKGYYLFQFQRYNGDVVIGDNNQLYAAYQIVNNSYYSNLKEVVDEVNNVADEVSSVGAKFIFLSIPRKDAVMTNDLPKSYISSSNIYKKSVDIVTSKINSNVYFIDAYDLFVNSDFDCYFSNDHHITPRGGDLLYKEIISYIKNFDDVILYNFDDTYYVEETIVNGSFNRQIGQKVDSTSEELLLSFKNEINYVRYEDGKESFIDVFGRGNDYEAAYMGGDKAFTIIDTDREELPNILYVGSSFTNVLEALSISSFNKMVSVDYRHNKTGLSIADYVKEYDIDYVVYVPSQSNNAFSISMMKEHLGK